MKCATLEIYKHGIFYTQLKFKILSISHDLHKMCPYNLCKLFTMALMTIFPGIDFLPILKSLFWIRLRAGAKISTAKCSFDLFIYAHHKLKVNSAIIIIQTSLKNE